ncbi:MAG: hypothetical protein ACR2LR_19315 [Hassallia sp.]
MVISPLEMSAINRNNNNTTHHQERSQSTAAARTRSHLKNNYE